MDEKNDLKISLIETLESPEAQADYLRIMEILQRVYSDLGVLLMIHGRLGTYMLEDLDVKARGELALVVLSHWLSSFEQILMALDHIMRCPWIAQAILYYAPPSPEPPKEKPKVSKKKESK